MNKSIVFAGLILTVLFNILALQEGGWLLFTLYWVVGGMVVGIIGCFVQRPGAVLLVSPVIEGLALFAAIGFNPIVLLLVAARFAVVTHVLTAKL